MKESWFAISRGGMNQNTHLPRTCMAAAQRINPEKQKKAELKYNSRTKRAADVYFHTIKPYRKRYEQESNFAFKKGPIDPPLLLWYSNELEELEKRLDPIYLDKVELAGRDYRVAILDILGHQHSGIPLPPRDLHSMRINAGR